MGMLQTKYTITVREGQFYVSSKNASDQNQILEGYIRKLLLSLPREERPKNNEIIDVTPFLSDHQKVDLKED